MNIEERYFSLKHDITDNVKEFILNPTTLLRGHREGDRLHDTFAGVNKGSYKSSGYTIIIYVSDWYTKEQIQTKIYVDRKYNIINDNTISA
jgi:hypothetical protein